MTVWRFLTWLICLIAIGLALKYYEEPVIRWGDTITKNVKINVGKN